MFVLASGAPDGAEVRRRAWGLWSAGFPAPASRRWARTGPLRFPGSPSHTFALFPDPGRIDRTSPLAVRSMLPPGPTSRGLQRVHDIVANPGLQYLLPTLHEQRCRHPCKARFRLAGCAFTGRELNPLDCDERFQVTSVLLSRTFLTQAGRMVGASCSIWPSSRARRLRPRRCGGSTRSSKSSAASTGCLLVAVRIRA